MRISSLFVILFLQLPLWGTGLPEPILPLSRAIHSVDYYQAQAELWQSVCQQTPTQATAWLNYYTAARNASILASEQAYNLPSIVAQAREYVPNSFEVHYLTYWQSSAFDRRYDALQRAYALAPAREEIAFDMLRYYEVEGNEAAFAAQAQRLFEQGLLPNGILDWNYNALASVRHNGLLLTQAENDTYPAWILQVSKNIRPDVRVANLYDLLTDAAYRQRLFGELELPAFQRSISAPADEQLQALLAHISTHSQRPLHLGVATPARQRASLDGELYLTGLAFEHSTVYLDNLSLLQDRFEEVFLTEQLEFNLHYNHSQGIVDHMNLNYLPALALLHELYQDQGEQAAAQRTQSMALRIAERAGRLEVVGPFFGAADSSIVAPLKLPAFMRTLDKNMKQVDDALYSHCYETSNGEYRTFMAALQADRQNELLDAYQVHATDWRSLLPENYRDLPEEVLFERGIPNQLRAPVVNISHEAAEAFCAWLTETYNSSDHRRKRFQEVRFHLPSAEQWEQAARGGKDAAPYPWGGPYNQNDKGCYLSNFNPYLVSHSDTEAVFGPAKVPEAPGEDGAYFLVPVDAYFPNDFGLYNMSGNAAEMINTPGLTRGGGWQDPAYYTQIGSSKTEAAPSPNLGFRIFMTVIKE